jgi:nicotinate dehydrogenase subunit A
MMMRAHELLQKTPSPSEQEIRAALQPNLCRCGTHIRILRAVARAAQGARSASVSPAPAKEAVR